MNDNKLKDVQEHAHGDSLIKITSKPSGAADHPVSRRSNVNLEVLRERLEKSKGPLYWKSLEELAETPEFKAFVEDEFPERTPDWLDPVNRRTLLKVMASSMALAGLAACTKQPKELIVPYVRQPEDFVPGNPIFYATAMPSPGGAVGLLVESHLGRPTKVEGNPEHPGSLGSTDIWAQASVLDLWDPDRSQVVMRYGDISSWGTFDGALAAAKEESSEDGGAGIAILSRPVVSLTLAAQVEAVKKALPNVSFHQWDPAGRHNVNEGTRLAFGAYANPVYDLTKADVIVSLDSDFLVSGGGHVRYAREYADARRVRTNITAEPASKADRQEGFQTGPAAPFRNQASEHVEHDDSPSPKNVVQAKAEGKPLEETTQNRLYVIEPAYSPTGASADHHFRVRASEVEGFARDLAAAVGVPGISGTGSPHHAIAAIAADLKAHRGKCVVIVGEFQPPVVHALGYAINEALGNRNETISFTQPLEAFPVDEVQSIRDLTASMNAGKVKTLLILGGNPVYDAPADLNFGEALKKVKTRIHLTAYNNETSIVCQWQLPEAHFLETWGDTRAYDGTVTVQQPLIAPLYGGKTAIEILAALAGNAGKSAHDLVKEYWTARLGENNFEKTWQIALHDGIIEGRLAPINVSVKPPAAAPSAVGQGREIIFRPDASVLDGSFANNGWLQELPKPTTKLTWDNVVWMCPSDAQQLGVQNEDLVAVNFQGRSVEGPVWIAPGHAANSISVQLGYGRTAGGRIASGIGYNAYKLRTSDALYHGTGVEIRKIGKRYPLADTQLQHSMEERAPIRVATIEEYKKDPYYVGSREGAEASSTSLYPDYKYEGYKWGMSIDLNVCIGCNACNIACQAENNISVVGKEETAKGRQMQWIRIDRYYAGNNLDDPELLFQPVTCMMCEDAPCELVCPVAATVHSGDGLNQMVYNRCVGTRYCSNNCPYKVRRFNFLLYADWYTKSLEGLRNPDVTVRSRGVMEKCSYCVQRISSAKILSERENRRIRDGEIIPACAQACPTKAIVFGDINDPNSEVAKLKRQVRNYGLLEDLNTRPRTTYLGRLRNPNPDLEGQKG
jgi:molybdopterin-containing oxidoreductase family iron-sulfur binding subunit